MASKSKKFIIPAVAIIVVAVAVVTILFTRNSPDVLRVGYMRIASHAPLMHAIEQKTFDKYDLKVRGELYPTTADLINALEQKKIDVAFQVTPDLAWKSSNKIRDDYNVYFVARSTKASPMDGFYAMTDLTRDSLLHQTIGHFPGLTGRFATQEILRRVYDLAPKDYTLTDVPPSMQTTMLQKSEIRALFTYEPIGTTLVKVLRAKNVIPAPVEQHIINPWNGGIGIFSSDLVKHKRSIAVKFQQAIKEAAEQLAKSRNLPLYVATLKSLDPGIVDSVAILVPDIQLVFPSDADQIDDMKKSLDEQFTMYKDLGILEQDDSHYLKIFDPNEK